MNANQWPLRKMKHEVFDVPHSLDECEERLELLNEPPPRLERMFGKTRYDAHTKVIKLVKTNPSNIGDLYCVQRTHPFSNGIMHVYAEMNVGLRPAGDITHVILYLPPRLNKAYLRAMLINSATVLVFALVAAAMSWLLGYVGPLVLLFLGVGSVLVFPATVLHFSESRSVLQRQVRWALTFGSLSEGLSVVNANKWSLREMEHEVYTVLYSLDECETRLEQLDEPEPRFYFANIEGHFASRTKVIRMVKTNPANQDSLYCVQRVHKVKQGSAHIYAEVNVGLKPHAPFTRVILYKPSRMTYSQKWHMASNGVSILTLIAMGMFIAQSFSNFLAIAPQCVVVPTIIGMTLNYRHFVRARRRLHRQIMQALTLEPHIKE